MVDYQWLRREWRFHDRRLLPPPARIYSTLVGPWIISTKALPRPPGLYQPHQKSVTSEPLIEASFDHMNLPRPPRRNVPASVGRSGSQPSAGCLALGWPESYNAVSFIDLQAGSTTPSLQKCLRIAPEQEVAPSGRAVASRLLPGFWTGASRLPKGTSTRIRVAVRRTRTQ
jgi:hypothetical protein